MPDIPLRSVHKLGARKLNGYTPLHADADLEQQSHTSPMESPTTSTNRSKNINRARHHEAAGQDSEESRGLLDGNYDEGWKPPHV